MSFLANCTYNIFGKLLTSRMTRSGITQTRSRNHDASQCLTPIKLTHPLVYGILGCLFASGCISIDTYPTPSIVDVNTVIDFLFRFSHYQDRRLKDHGQYDATDRTIWPNPTLVSGYEAVKRRNYSCSFRAQGKLYSATCNPGAGSSNRISLYIDESATIRVEVGRPAGPQSGIYRGKRPPE